MGYVDFTPIRYIGPDAALVLASEYDRVRSAGGWLPRTIDLDRWDPQVLGVLNGIGFMELLDLGDGGAATSTLTDDLRVLKFRANSEADGATVAGLLGELGLEEATGEADLYGVIVEAIVNTRQHAYPRNIDLTAPSVPKWWLSATLNMPAKRLRVSVFDQGATIPRTLHTWELYPKLTRFWAALRETQLDPMNDQYDGPAIGAAMAIGRSATGEAFRGRGLPFIESLLDYFEDGRMTIVSRRGSYSRIKGHPPIIKTNRTPLHGTLISWDLRFT